MSRPLNSSMESSIQYNRFQKQVGSWYQIALFFLSTVLIAVNYIFRRSNGRTEAVS